ncbi:MAG: single-stranded-DNA-specific exonuclease RecJ [Patescibacteria group bacterium]|jgi:single-stranded-DNA-specific exonuclease
MKKVWRVRKAVTGDVLAQFPEMHPLVVQLLVNRGITTQEQIEKFLTPDYKTDSHDPFLFRDMRKAVDRIFSAAEKKEKVVIYGDYDADGVCASAILKEMLNKVGIEPHIHLPHREKEGYGMNMKAAKEFIKKKFDLVVTCDCGVTSIEEIDALQKAGIDVIVTDHHAEPPKLPQAFAILNPSLKNETYPFKHLVGTGVAFKLTQAVLQEAPSHGISVTQGEEKWMLDLVAIATIADFGDLIDENRTFTAFGLFVLEKTRRPGLKALKEFMNGSLGTISSEMVGYQLVPRLNAASRMDHANTALSLLTETDSVAAFSRAQELQKLNQDRQKVSDKMFQEGKKQFGEKPEEKLLVAVGDGWQAGVVGLVAGKLLHLYHRPVLVIGKQKDEIVGSGRSIQHFDITKALHAVSEHLDKFGGHPQACGFTVKNGHLDAFIQAIKEQAEGISDAELEDELEIDAEVSLDEISWELWEDLKKFEPFGECNPQPVFACKKVVVESMRSVGKSGQHLQIMVKHNSEVIRKTIAFGFASAWAEQLPQGQEIDIAFEVSLNEWNGSRELQLRIVDIRDSKAVHDV